MTIDSVDDLIDELFENILAALESGKISIGGVKDSFDVALNMVLDELEIEDDSN